MTITHLPQAAPEWREASAALVDATRDLMLAVAVTDADAAELDAVRAELEQLTTRLGRSTRRRALRQPFEAPAEVRAAGPGTSYCMSVASPHGLPLWVRFDGEVARATYTANALHEGPPDCVHGGVSAWLMDTLLGVLVQSTGRPAMTGRLELRYRRPTPLDVPLELTAEITERSGKRLVVDGRIEADGVTTVDARGLFVEVPMRQPTVGG